MRFSKTLVCGLSVLLMCNSSFAKQNNNCPSLDVIKSSNFTHASKLINDWWVLTTDTYSHDSKTWITSFKFPAYFANEQEALNQGKVTFNSVISSLNEPKDSGDNLPYSCTYSDSYDYYVTAMRKSN